MKVLVACEFSGVVREAFNQRGHKATSADLLPTEIPGDHYQGDVLEILDQGWDLMIAHPPCTYLSTVGNRWFKTDPTRYEKRLDAAIFWLQLWHCDISKVCIENPQGYMNTHWKKPTHTIHPYYFGDPQLKRTCLWTRGLSHLEIDSNKHPRPEPMYICQGEKCMGKKIYYTEGIAGTGSQENRQKERSRTFPGIAAAMAEQWGDLK